MSPIDPIPDFGSPTGGGFVAKCYWVGTFKSAKRASGQGVIGAFGQLLSPLCYSQTTDFNFIATEEYDAAGKMRVVLRGAKWSTAVTNLHYWFRPNRRENAGPNVKAGGSLPLDGPGAPRFSVTHGAGVIGAHLEIDPTHESLRFEVRHRLPDMRPRPEWKENDLVRTGAAGADERWIAPIHGFGASEEPVTPNRRTVIRQEWGDPGGDEYETWVVTRICEHDDVLVKLITPRGDPVTAPRTSGDGQNEWTFDTGSPGKLMVTLKAEVIPEAAATRTRDRVLFEMEPVNGSAFAWHADNPGGKPVLTGRFLVARAVCTGLPARNSDFGRRKVRLLVDGEVAAQTYIEVFFPRDATNHPGGQAGSPNWFFYYLQTVPRLGPNPKLLHSTVHGSHYEPSANQICIDDGAIKAYTPEYGAFGTLYGIDTFAWCVTHEMQHYKDWADFWEVDRLGTSKQFAARGRSGPDDDYDNDHIPNRIEDGNGNGVFDGGDRYNWKLRRTPGPPVNILNDFEDWNCRRHTTVRGDHRQDWADPGMQHKTLRKHDD